MKNEFESWLEQQKQQGLKDFKCALDGDTSDVSVNRIEEEIVRLHKMAKADITIDFPKTNNHNINLNLN